VHLVGFTIEIYYDARSCKCQILWVFENSIQRRKGNERKGKNNGKIQDMMCFGFVYQVCFV